MREEIASKLIEYIWMKNEKRKLESRTHIHYPFEVRRENSKIFVERQMEQTEHVRFI